MEKRKLAEIIGILGLVILGGLQVDDLVNSNEIYKCSDRAALMVCDHLSYSRKTCYNDNPELGNRRCTSGWEVFDILENDRPSGEFILSSCGKENYECYQNIMVRK